MNKIIFPNGQTCNKFFSLLAPLSYSIENGCTLNVLLPDKALIDYPNLINNEYLKFPLWKPGLAKLIGYKAYEDWTRRLFVYLLKKNPLIPKSVKKRILWETWEDRGFVVTDEFLPVVRQIFSPKDEIIQAVSAEMKSIRSKQKNTLIVGCHFRRGDYKTWQGGRYYFSNEDWRRFMTILGNLFPDKHVRFFISTNEKLEIEEFNQFDAFRLESVSSAAGDLYALSQCDYIVGPPSTFSNWAALVGQKPLYHIPNKDTFLPKFNVPTSNIGIGQ